jgi:hypothetical protein
LKDLISTIVTTQIDRVPPSPAFPLKRCTHQSIELVDILTIVQRTIRKDTAAYASLPLSTMSKSKSHPHQRTKKEPQAPRHP